MFFSPLQGGAGVPGRAGFPVCITDIITELSVEKSNKCTKIEISYVLYVLMQGPVGPKGEKGDAGPPGYAPKVGLSAFQSMKNKTNKQRKLQSQNLEIMKQLTQLA